MTLPIGSGSRVAALECLLDPGAGCNLGRYSHHKAVADLYSELVIQFIDLTKCGEGIGPFPIGDISGDDKTQVTHLITYCSPHKEDGVRPAPVTFALAQECACDSIVSLPWLQAIKANVLFPSMSIVSDLYGKVFKMRLKMPSHSNTVPQSAIAGETLALAVRPRRRPSFVPAEPDVPNRYPAVCPQSALDALASINQTILNQTDNFPLVLTRPTASSTATSDNGSKPAEQLTIHFAPAIEAHKHDPGSSRDPQVKQ